MSDNPLIPRRSCPVSELPFTKEQRGWFDEAIALPNQEAPTAHILRTLKHDWKISIGRDSLREHRAGECNCYRD